MNWAIRKLNYKIDADALKEMYNSLMSNYRQRMFVVGEHAGFLKKEYGDTAMYGWTFDKAYGWALQTWEEDLGQPLAFINCGPSQFSDIQNTELTTGNILKFIFLYKPQKTSFGCMMKMTIDTT